MMNRRSLFLGAASLLVAPAIVRAGSLMPVKKPLIVEPTVIRWVIEIDYENIANTPMFLTHLVRKPVLGETLGETRE